jgi:hypothetical protein
MEALLTAALLAWTDLTVMVLQRVNWLKLPDRRKLPAVTLHRISGVSFGGTLFGRTPTNTWRIQFDCWGATDAEASAVRDAVVGLLDTLHTAPLQFTGELFFHDGWEPAQGAQSTDRSTDLFRASVDAVLVHGGA